MKTEEPKTKKPKLKELKQKHGVSVSKKRADYLRFIPHAKEGSYKESKGSIPNYSILGMHASGLIYPSPAITCISGMLWCLTDLGVEQLGKIESLEKEYGQRYGLVS